MRRKQPKPSNREGEGLHPDAADLAKRITNLVRCPVTLSEEYIRGFVKETSAEIAEILLTRRNETATHPPLNIISLKAYRELREDGHTPTQALLTLRETQFEVGDIVVDKDGGSHRRVVAVKHYEDDTVLGLEGAYNGEPMFDARFFIRIRRRGEA
jgi:hypothetical protein